MIMKGKGDFMLCCDECGSLNKLFEMNDFSQWTNACYDCIKKGGYAFMIRQKGD